jgi:uncharacterized protein YigE (DUF2233 family)
MFTIRVFSLLLTLALATHAEWRAVRSTPLAAPEGIEFREVKVAAGTAAATLHEVRFTPKTHTLAVMDDPADSFTLATAARKRGAVAAVNGGYFHPDRTPLGLVVRQGREIHPLERAQLLSGLVVVTPQRIALVRPAEFKPSAAVREALQAGPFLVDGGKAVAGLNATRPAARTVVFVDAAGRFGFIVVQSATLAEAGAMLATPALFPKGRITRALNLDGGTSTGLWVRGEPDFYQREWKDVRNYLAIVPR